VRIIPVIGKSVGDMVEFGGLLGSAPIMSIQPHSSERFIHRGGRIPAPINSLRN
ncbi:MAG TPA: PFL family protein, partial [bacterium]|nr:PFL family protein [bacterium]